LTFTADTWYTNKNKTKYKLKEDGLLAESSILWETEDKGRSTFKGVPLSLKDG